MKLRTFVLADYDAVVDLWNRVGVHLSKADTFASVMHKLERDPELFLVAEENERIVGAVLGSYDGINGWIQHMAVHPDFQGQGVGTRMLTELEKRFKAVGCRKLNVLFLSDSPELKAFYEKAGFEYRQVALMEKPVEGVADQI
jgi:ribosomal protein S18 acetylase RimI-like enzyme